MGVLKMIQCPVHGAKQRVPQHARSTASAYPAICHPTLQNSCPSRTGTATPATRMEEDIQH